jgi:hypothetical protein
VPIKRTVLSLFAVVCLAASLQGAVVARYDFGTASVPSVSSSDSDLNSAASAFSAGAGYATVITPDTTRGNPAPDLTIPAATMADSQALALSGNDYFTFNLTPVSAVNLSTLKFDIAVEGSVTASYFLQAAVGAGSFANVGSTVSTSSTTWSTQTISLSAAQFQSLTLPVTFRIYVFDNAKSGASMRGLLDNVTLDAVPEPSTWAMMGLGAGLLGAVQRFRRKLR